MDGGAHWSRRIEPNPKILPRILREPAARDFQSQGESQPLKGCPEPCLQGRREEMAQQSAKRDSTMHLLKHVGTLQTFDEEREKSNEYTIQIFCKTTTEPWFSNWSLGTPRRLQRGYRFDMLLIHSFICLFIIQFFQCKKCKINLI